MEGSMAKGEDHCPDELSDFQMFEMGHLFVSKRNRDWNSERARCWRCIGFQSLLRGLRFDDEVHD